MGVLASVNSGRSQEMEARPIRPKWTRKTLSSPEEPEKVTSAPLSSKCEWVKKQRANSPPPSLPPPPLSAVPLLPLSGFFLSLSHSLPLPSPRLTSSLLFPPFSNSPSLPPLISENFLQLLQSLPPPLLLRALRIHLPESRPIPLALCFPMATSMLSSIHQSCYWSVSNSSAWFLLALDPNPAHPLSPSVIKTPHQL